MRGKRQGQKEADGLRDAVEVEEGEERWLDLEAN